MVPGVTCLCSQRGGDHSHRLEPRKKILGACVLDLLSFLCYLELCVHIFRDFRSVPETHESGVYPAWEKAQGVPPSHRLEDEMLSRSNYISDHQESEAEHSHDDSQDLV